MSKSNTLEERIYDQLRLVNSRRKCEFLAFFPQRGTTQKELAEEGFFSNNRSVVYYYSKKYIGFIQKQEKADDEGYKLMWLTSEGENLQKVARYMLITGDEINNTLGTDVDYLDLFFEKGNPQELVRAITSIYEGGATRQSALYRVNRDKNTQKMVDRLEEFGLIKTHLGGKGRAKKRSIEKTEAGQMYYTMLLEPTLDFIKAGYELGKHKLALDVLHRWDSYVQKRNSSKSS